jgi:preprotein translocase subunit SecF
MRQSNEKKQNSITQKLGGLLKKDWAIVEKWKTFFIVSGAIILAGIIIAAIVSFNLGIDFAGGYSVEIKYSSGLDKDNYDEKAAEITRYFEAVTDEDGEAYGLRVNSIQLQENNVDDESTPAYSVLIRYKAVVDDSEMSEVNAAILEQLGAALKASDDPYAIRIQESTSVAAGIGNELALYALIAVLTVTLFVGAYAWLRFGLKSGVSAVVSILHDLLIMTALMALFRIELNTNYIAAVVAVLGFSANNAIVLFSRLHEYGKNPAYKEIGKTQRVNLAVRDTSVRTLSTCLTSIIIFLILTIIGVPAIRQFALPIVLGLLSCFYSAICVAPSLWALMANKKKKQSAYSKTVASKKPA